MNKEIVYYRESLLSSIIADLTTFGCMCGCFWFNYRFVGNSAFFNGVILVMFLIFMIMKAANKRQTFTSKKALLDYLKDEENHE